VAGLGSYRVVILGYAQYVSVEALTKLTHFTEAGGTVIFVGETPEHGLLLEQEDAIAALMAKLDSQPRLKNGAGTQLIQTLEKLSHRDLSVQVINGDKKNLLMADFESSDRDVTFLVNASYTDAVVQLAYTDGYAGKATLYHPATGYIETITPGEGKEITVPACTGLILMREADNTRDDTPYIPSDEPVTLPGDTTHAEGETDAPKKSGCRSAAGLSTALLALMASPLLFTKKKES